MHHAVGARFSTGVPGSAAAMRTLGKPTVLALTATAPPEVVDDIAQQLNMGPLHIVNTGVHRPNLAYRVRPVTSDTDKQRQLLETVRGLYGAAIIYAATVKHVQQIDALLRQEGVPAVAYHGRMRASDRAAAQDAFMNGRSDSLSPLTPLAWGSTGRTSGRSSTTTCRPPWMCTPRNLAVLGATACLRSASCCFSALIEVFRRFSWPAGIRPLRTSPA